MKKKVAPKKVTRSRKKTENYRIIGFSIITIGCVLLFFVGVITYNFATQSNVLGASTYIAQGGDDSGGSDGSGSGSSGGSDSPSSGGSDAVAPTGISGNGSSGGSNDEAFQQPPSEFPGKTPFGLPQGLRRNHDGEFPPRTEVTGEPRLGKLDTSKDNAPLDEISSDGATQVNLNQEGTHVEIKKENGKLSIKAKKPDGTEIELKDNSLNDVNKTLETENGPQIEQNGSGVFGITKNGTTANTNFPLSVDVNTHQLTVTTPSGVKNVAVLPDQAVTNLITKGIISGVQQANTGNTIQLTESNSTPVFQVQGVSNQKLLGIIPDTIHKTVSVSAQDGSVASIQESLAQEIIDLLSF